jgi:diguanylate cyclase (GGDEF)-like protein
VHISLLNSRTADSWRARVSHLAGTAAFALSLTALCLPAQALNPDRLPSQYLLDRYSRDSGLPSDRVWVSRQGPRGYLWIGTQGGLARFDGADFKIFSQQTDPAFKASDIRTLKWTPAGDLWIGTYGGGAMRMRDGRFETFTADDGLAGNIVYAIHRAVDGTLWFATDDGISQYDGSAFRSWGVQDGLVAKRILKIVEDSTGGLWFSSITGGVSFFDGDGFKTIGTAQGLDSPQVHLLHHDERLGVIVGTRSGHLYSVSAEAPATRLAFSRSNPIEESLRDRDGNQWLGSYGEGLWRIRPDGTEEHLSFDGGSETQHVFDLHEDNRGNLWIATPRGLFSLRDSPFLAIGNAEGLADSTFVLTAQADGSVWVGTESKGLFRIASDGRLSQPYPAMQATSISSLLAARDGSLWVGTFGNGLFRLNGELSEHFTEDHGLSGSHVFALQEMQDGAVWAATDFGLSRWAADTGEIAAALPGQNSVIFRHINQGRDGSVWLSSSKGLYRYKDGELKHWTTKDGLVNNVVSSTYEDKRGILWITTNDGSLSRLDGDQLFSFGSEHGLMQSSAYAILEDGAHNLWISGAGGMLRVSYNSLDAVARGERKTLESRVFDVNDGLRSTQFIGGYQPAAWATPDNRLWFVTTRGVVAFAPQALAVESPSLNTYIDAVRVDGKVVELGDTINLPASVKSLEIDYSTPELGNAQALSFRYSTSDNAEFWVDAGSRRTAYFNALPAGRSLFRVQARLGSGPFADGDATLTSLRFYQQPRWYETTWSVLAAVALIVLFVIALQRFLNRQAHRREQQLRRLVDLRTGELREALVRVEANSRIDSLTGVANRRHLEEHLASVWNMSRRSNLPVSILMLDIDRFKQYNDTLGHAAGDACLRSIARGIRDRLLREHDMLARYGGEEFVVVLYDTDSEGALQTAQRILDCVATLVLPHPASDISDQVTLSIGCATAGAQALNDPHKLIDYADQALYRAKDQGRNRVCSWSSLAADTPLEGR